MSFEAIKNEASGHIHRELGEPIRYHYTRDGITKNMCGIFTMVDAVISMEGQVPVDTQKPMCSIRACDMNVRPRKGDMITRRNITYEITQVKENLSASYGCMLLLMDDRAATQRRDLS
jgi:hypothetical protein